MIRNEFNLFTEKYLERHSRHILLSEIGIDGIKKISKGKVLIIGLGGLGSPVVSYLAAGGIGFMGLADYDKIDRSNLNRQIIFSENDVGKYKVKVGSNRVKQINSQIQTKIYPEKIDQAILEDIAPNYDLIIDAVDVASTKWMIHDTCFRLNKPLIYAGVLGCIGQILTILPKKTSCLKCFFPKPDKNEINTCAKEGILGPLCGVIGSMQAAEALRFFSLQDKLNLAFINSLFQLDLSSGWFEHIKPVITDCIH